ncbi:MAG: hypothetical protein CMC08_08415 [Flavobacteriaceae bacterium]|nr:hypothetical protein [Flavobacteriaceae bacterium]
MKTISLYVALFALVFSLNAQDVDIELFASGFSSPVTLQHAGDERLFVVEQGGRIKILNPNGSINSTPFLDITSQVSIGNERGLLGLAFHPNYASNGYFYVNYTKANGDTRVSRFSVSGGNPDLADPNSESIVLEYSQPFSNHNGGCLAFGPDGYLYISSGDGGASGDPGNRAQNTTLLLGKLLRIDVDTPGGVEPYEIPSDNPFAGSNTNAEEIWAYGLRNPWRFSFDTVEGNLWIADVGQASREEVNKVPVSAAGLNFGWRCYEGDDPFNNTGCPPAGDLTFPVFDYTSASPSSNCSITGGYVYRGSKYTDISGLYLFADYCSGLIGSLDDTNNFIDHGSFSGNWVSFGEDVNKELYIVSIGGSIYSITGGVLGTSEPTAVEMRMYPNPARENVFFQIENDRIESIELRDIKGSLIHRVTALSNETASIATAKLSEGFYLVRVRTENGALFTEKLLVQ